MDLRPLGDKVVVKPKNEEEVTKGGIVLPDTAAKERPQEGEVISVGKGRILDSGERVGMEVKPNDRVIFSKYSGTEFKIDEEDYLILSEKDILAIIES